MGTALGRGLDEGFVLVEVVEVHLGLAHLEQATADRHVIDDPPLGCSRQQGVEDGEHVVDRLGGLAREVGLETLDVLGDELVQALAAQPRDDVDPQDRLLGGNAARLLSVGSRVPVEVAGGERRERGDLLSLGLLGLGSAPARSSRAPGLGLGSRWLVLDFWGLAPGLEDELLLELLAPPACSRLGRDRRPDTASDSFPIGEHDQHIDFPAALPVGPYLHAHR